MNISSVEFNDELWNKLDQFSSTTLADDEIIDTVNSILDEVKKNGDEALLEKTKLYDGANLEANQLPVTGSELDNGLKSLSSEELGALEDAKVNILNFHESSLPKDWQGINSHGALYGERHYPIQRVGLYVPGGNVPLVSTVLMTATLAKVAKVPEIVVVTPPSSDGKISNKLLGALRFAGISEIYRVGGAQAIAALAHGTDTIRQVDKIFGPGNAFVNEAKRQVFGKVGIDLLPGPSEVMVIADESAKPRFVAAALLAQAEHGSGKEKVYLVYTEKSLLSEIRSELEDQVIGLKNKEAVVHVLNHGFLAIHAPKIEDAVKVANFLAPEHLELQVADKQLDYCEKNIHTAGALLLGHYSATALGDFVAGPSHVLPTGRSSRFSSGLRVVDFLRRSSIIKYDQEAVIKAKQQIECFALMESLDGHGSSVEIRTSSCD